MALYVTTSDVNALQIKIIRFVNEWATKEKTPVPQKEIIANMEKQNENMYTVIGALNILIKKGYIGKVKIYGSGLSNYYKALRSI